MDRSRDGGGNLPWGWWLRASGSVLEDDDGRTWRSVRDAFWQGHLSFPDAHFAAEQHELLLRVLTAIEGRWGSVAEQQHDLFGGDMMSSRFYRCWLISIGLLDAGVSFGNIPNPLQGGLTDLGRSVMLMLQATREPAWQDLPMVDVIDAVAEKELGQAGEAREKELNAFEREVGHRRYVFARERVGRSHLITLTGISTGIGARMPVRRVMWSQSFTDTGARDDLFAWLAMRVGRWDDWGALAYENGAEALTGHLFTLFIVGMGKPA
ncbi:hypothetical protein OKW76_12535 [Sphingomonas sp. S1-29]|uniref:hypothetical protein n=1 Tax=Sphingomonas sp. S1-29 TaxID=2991074 RepID=UPI0022400281|nr:hypothetical protein [Sphingomonas sp. S1-29]UZK68856.1 hypothetical protein OKW76_12535 [Sphingomonas sp. S1-29]